MQNIIASTAKIVNKNKSTNTFSRNTACFSRFVLSEGESIIKKKDNEYFFKSAGYFERFLK